MNALDDLTAHANLNGKIFKRKSMDPKRLYGLGYFGISALTYMTFPQMVLHFGSTCTYAAMIGSSFMGMVKFQEKNVINSIETVKEGDKLGKLLITISTSPFTSSTIYADPQDVQGVFSVGNDDVGEDDVENNVVHIAKYTSGNETHENASFLLPADSWKDVNALDWVLSIKNTHYGADETASLFNDLMITQFEQKQELSKIGKLAIWQANSNYNRSGPDSSLDHAIDKNDSSVDSNLEEMKQFYGQEQLDKMTPSDFYLNYKKFASG